MSNGERLANLLAEELTNHGVMVIGGWDSVFGEQHKRAYEAAAQRFLDENVEEDGTIRRWKRFLEVAKELQPLPEDMRAALIEEAADHFLPLKQWNTS